MALLTEDEAKSKWCPLARTVEFDGRNSSLMRNRVVRVDHNFVQAEKLLGSQCIASACMAWRTGTFDHQRNLKPENRTPGVGYCGAFGKPLVTT